MKIPDAADKLRKLTDKQLVRLALDGEEFLESAKMAHEEIKEELKRRGIKILAD